MSPRGARWIAACLALIAVPSLAQPTPASDPALDAKRDTRLARRFMLRSEGMYVSHVLRRLGAKSGVALSVSGRAGDERLIAFVPEAPLAEVLASIADLYNLKWARETKDGKISYQLFKPLSRVREEGLLKEKALIESLAELNRQANEPSKNRRDPDGHHAVMRAAAIAAARANWEKIAAEGHLELRLKDLPEEYRAPAPPRARALLEATQQTALDSDRRTREAILEKGGKLPDDLKEEPQPRPLGEPDTWRLVFDLKTNQGIKLDVLLWSDGFGVTLFNGQAAQGDAPGVNLYKDRTPRPSLPVGRDAPLPNGDPLAKPLFALNAPPVKPSHLSTPWLNAVENLSEMGGVAVYSDDYSNPQSGGKQRRAEPPVNGQTAQTFLDRWCGVRSVELDSAPPSFWWRRGSAVMIRSRSYLHESESVLPAAFTENMLSHRAAGKLSLLLPDDLLTLSRLSMPQLHSLINFSGEMEGWRRAVQIPARLSPPSRALAVGAGLRWEQMALADQQLAQQLSQGGRAIGPGFATKILAFAEGPSWRSRCAISVRMETDLTPGSGYGISIPAPQLNPQGLIVMDAALAKASQAAGERLVIAKYYPWYGLEAFSGQQRRVKLGKDKINNFAHYPASGPYDSSDEAAMRRHIDQLKSAGVDALTCYWPGPDGFEDKALRKLAPIARERGVRFCLYLEEIQRQPLEKFAGQLARAVKDLGEGYLRVDGKPVVMVEGSARDVYTHQEWSDLIELLARTASPGFVLVTGAHGSSESAIFSGTVINSGISWGDDETPLSIARAVRVRSIDTAALVQRRKRICVAQVTPGIDYRHLPGSDSQIDRIEGGFYKALWDAARDCGADWVVIDSFNQWEIGTEIEPSREYGDLYLKLTAEQAALFKGGK